MRVNTAIIAIMFGLFKKLSVFMLLIIISCNTATASEDDLGDIIRDFRSQVLIGLKTGTAIVSEELLEKFIDRAYKVNSITSKGAKIAVRRAMRELSDVNIKSLSADLIVGLIVDAAADAVMEDILNQNIAATIKVPLAATAYITIRSSYVVYASNGNLPVIAAGQIMLLADIAKKDVEAAIEAVNARDLKNIASLRAESYEILLKYLKLYRTERDPVKRAEILAELNIELANLAEKYGVKSDYFLAGLTAGAGNLQSSPATENRSAIEEMFYLMAEYIKEELISSQERWEAENPYSGFEYNTYVPAPTSTGFINDPFSLTTTTQPTLVSNYVTNPDLTDDLQQDIIDAAEPTDPPAEGLWAGRMSLSGHFISGTNAENSGPVTGVVTAMEASGEAPLSDFILFRPEQGSMNNPIQGVQTAASIGHNFTHLMWGSWTGGPRSWTDDGSRFGDLSGFFVYGELTPPTARSSGVATYTGRLRGDVIEEGGVIQSGLAYGDFGLTANFGTGALGGWLAIAADNSTNYVFVSDISNANIVRQSDNLHFYGDIGTNLQEGMGHIEGYFFGANATELGGTYELSSSVGGSTHGILLGWETGTMPTKPVFADGSKRAHISTQMPDGYILDSSLDILTVPAQGQPSVALAVPQEQGGGTVSTSQVYAQNGYSYTSWGKWRANDSTPDSYSNGGYWAAGDATSGSAIQNKTGSATYSGEIIGDHVSNGVRQAAEGSIHLTADFNADRISGDMEFHTETTSMTPAPIDAAIQDSGYFGQIGNDSANGNFGFGVQGNFFGPNADEVGGSAWASTDEGTYNGVFRAKQ